MIDRAAWRSIRAVSKRNAAKDLRLTIHGLEHLPPDGPVLLVARHYHHLYD
jgi:putative membrane protein